MGSGFPTGFIHLNSYYRNLRSKFNLVLHIGYKAGWIKSVDVSHEVPKISLYKTMLLHDQHTLEFTYFTIKKTLCNLLKCYITECWVTLHSPFTKKKKKKEKRIKNSAFMQITHTTSTSQVNPGIQHLTVDRHVLFLILFKDQFQRFERSDFGVFKYWYRYNPEMLNKKESLK